MVRINEREVKGMEKTVVFSEKDMLLIEKIDNYRKTKGLDFSDAVKTLCEECLTGNVKLEWGSFGE